MKSVYETRRENLRGLMTQWGGPTSLAYEHTKLTGRVDEPFIQKLVRLTGK